MIHRLLLIASLFVLFPCLIYSQKLVSDSLVVDFGFTSESDINASTDTVIDQRHLRPNCIAISEKKKFLVVPVDYYILTQKPVSTEIKDMFSNKTDSSTMSNYRLEIKEFDIGSESRFFTNKFVCNSIISVYENGDNKKNYIGTLVYEIQTSGSTAAKKQKKSYEACIDAWKEEFTIDMNFIAGQTPNDSTGILKNLIKQEYGFSKNLIMSAEVAAGTNSWLIDGELMFSHPEPQQQFFRQGKILRYRHEEKYQSLEFSIANNQFNYRLTDNFAFVLKSKLFWGLNSWNKNEYTNHGLQDIFLVDLSLSQSILYNPFYKRGFICGMGLLEDMTYIYSENIKFKPYVVFQLGIKL